MPCGGIYFLFYDIIIENAEFFNIFGKIFFGFFFFRQSDTYGFPNGFVPKLSKVNANVTENLRPVRFFKSDDTGLDSVISKGFIEQCADKDVSVNLQKFLVKGI